MAEDCEFQTENYEEAVLAAAMMNNHIAVKHSNPASTTGKAARVDKPSISSEMSTSSSVFLKPVEQRKLGPKLIKEEPSPRDLLFDQIKRAASVSDDHIYDGTGKNELHLNTIRS